MRLVFAGTPQTAVPALDALLASPPGGAAVGPRPAAPAGRGRKVEPSPVAQRALAAGLEVLTPARARDPQFLDRLREIAPDCCPVVAYGALLPQAALDIPPRGWVNLHFSLLPAWRGAAPVQHAILHGDDVTGASTFDIVAELDGIEADTVHAVPQAAEGVSFAPKINPADARVDWKRPAHVVDRLIRACTPDPGAWTELDGARIKLGPSDHSPEDAPDLAPGELLAARHAVFVGTGSRPVRLGEVQAPGKRLMAAPDWARGLPAGGRVRFGEHDKADLTCRSQPSGIPGHQARAGPASPGPASPGPASPGPASPARAGPARAGQERAGRVRIRRAGPPTTSCARSMSATPTPTCCCPPY